MGHDGGRMMRVIGWGMLLLLTAMGSDVGAADKLKMLVVSSYHREYRWSQQTNTGFCDALLKLGYLDSQAQADEFTKTDTVESSTTIIKKLWMDTKRKSSKEETAEATRQITEAAKTFAPDLIFLGDDNAANYIGNNFLDTKIPIVFWGVNNTPLSYGLVDSVDHPGHNVTGVYQAGYYVESLQLLKTLVPEVETFAILSDNSETGLAHLKAVELLAREGALPIELVTSVATEDFAVWKRKALELQQQVDALFIAQYSALKDAEGRGVPAEDVARWHLANITIPETVGMRQFVEQGMLCGADDSAYNQGYEAVVIAHDILSQGASPSAYPPRAPKRGPLMVNVHRAKTLHVTLGPNLQVEEYIDQTVAAPQAAAQ